jgi:hypothetical protein
MFLLACVNYQYQRDAANRADSMPAFFTVDDPIDTTL